MSEVQTTEVQTRLSKANTLGKQFFNLFIIVVLSLLIMILLGLDYPDKYIIIDHTIPGIIPKKFYQHYLVLIFVFFIFIFLSKKKYLSLFSLKPLKNKEPYYWIAVIFIFEIIIISLSSKTTIHFRLFPITFWEYFQLIIITSVIAPIAEELFLRGLLLFGPDKKFRTSMLVFSSLLFAFTHEKPEISHLVTGFGCGLLALRFRNMILPIIYHSVSNLLVSFFEWV
ncbi:CPBP family glutamic-type intramembrane protease [Peribacillus butanolivorans]